MKITTAPGDERVHGTEFTDAAYQTPGQSTPHPSMPGPGGPHIDARAVINQMSKNPEQPNTPTEHVSASSEMSRQGVPDHSDTGDASTTSPVDATAPASSPDQSPSGAPPAPANQDNPSHASTPINPTADPDQLLGGSSAAEPNQSSNLDPSIVPTGPADPSTGGSSHDPAIGGYSPAEPNHSDPNDPLAKPAEPNQSPGTTPPPPDGEPHWELPDPFDPWSGGPEWQTVPPPDPRLDWLVKPEGYDEEPPEGSDLSDKPPPDNIVPPNPDPAPVEALDFLIDIPDDPGQDIYPEQTGQAEDPFDIDPAIGFGQIPSGGDFPDPGDGFGQLPGVGDFPDPGDGFGQLPGVGDFPDPGDGFGQLPGVGDFPDPGDGFGQLPGVGDFPDPGDGFGQLPGVGDFPDAGDGFGTGVAGDTEVGPDALSVSAGADPSDTAMFQPSS